MIVWEQSAHSWVSDLQGSKVAEELPQDALSKNNPSSEISHIYIHILYTLYIYIIHYITYIYMIKYNIYIYIIYTYYIYINK